MDNTQRHIVEGLQTGDQINQAVALIAIEKSVSMLKNALTSDFNTVFEAGLTSAVATALTEHAENSQAFALRFLGQVKTHLAGHSVETQQTHQIASIPESISLSQLESFDVDLDAEVARLADEAGAITIDINLDSHMGY